MADSQNTPKIFISYSWNPTTNKEKTLNLAERLINDGIDVIIDEWNLAEGQDKYQFMEQMVNESKIIRVLLICNKDYVKKANAKKGGVGVESLIISDEIYSKVDQKKFIPIVFERDENGDSYLPTFIKSRIYIDLSDEKLFEEEYEKLLRNIFEKPTRKKPPIGTPPPYLLEDEPIFLRTAHKVKTIKNALVNEKNNFQVFIDDYYNTFILAFEDFEITQNDIISQAYIDEIVLKKIEELKHLRDDFINFLDVTLTYSSNFNTDKFLSFLEKFLEFILNSKSNHLLNYNYNSLKQDHFKFFYYEIVLYITTIFIEKEKYKELGIILNSQFIIYDKSLLRIVPYSISKFNEYVESLNDFRNKRLQMRRIDVTADIIKQRADNDLYNFEKLQLADVILYFISISINIENMNDLNWTRWWPHTTVYRVYNLPFLDKLISKRQVEKIKYLFEAESIDELKQKVEEVIKAKADIIQRFDYDFPYFSQIFDFTKIATHK